LPPASNLGPKVGRNMSPFGLRANGWRAIVSGGGPLREAAVGAMRTKSVRGGRPGPSLPSGWTNLASRWASLEAQLRLGLVWARRQRKRTGPPFRMGPSLWAENKEKWPGPFLLRAGRPFGGLRATCTRAPPKVISLIRWGPRSSPVGGPFGQPEWGHISLAPP